MQGEHISNYTAVLIATSLGILAVALFFFISGLLAPRKRTEPKASTYECGMLPIGQYWSQIHIRYYLFAILFMIFDVETVFLYPWAVIFTKTGIVAFWEMMLFIFILLFGLAYAWKKGVLQWQ